MCLVPCATRLIKLKLDQTVSRLAVARGDSGERWKKSIKIYLINLPAADHCRTTNWKFIFSCMLNACVMKNIQIDRSQIGIYTQFASYSTQGAIVAHALKLHVSRLMEKCVLNLYTQYIVYIHNTRRHKYKLWNINCMQRTYLINSFTWGDSDSRNDQTSP